jgi:hypothetical protein
LVTTLLLWIAYYGQQIPPTDAIMSLPAEVIGKIAARLPPTDLLSFRRTNAWLAERSSDAFEAEYLTSVVLRMKHRIIEAQIRGLLELKDFAARVKKLRIESDRCQCQRRCKSNQKQASTKTQIGECVTALPSLRKLSYGCGSHQDPVLFYPKMDGQIIKLSNVAPLGLRVIDFSLGFKWGDIDVIAEIFIGLIKAHSTISGKIELDTVCMAGSPHENWGPLFFTLLKVRNGCSLRLFALMVIKSNGIKYNLDFEPKADAAVASRVTISYELR